MAQISPHIFVVGVFALVALTIIVPRLIPSEPEEPVAGEGHAEPPPVSLPSRPEPRVAVPNRPPAPPTEVLSTPPGAPRAIAPTRKPAATAPVGGRPLAPLELPTD